jgi:hypothetical protein
MNLLELYNNKTYNTDKENLHCYISEYYNHTFTPYKESNINLLEIGIRYGGSVELWRDFFTDATIYGIASGEEAITDVDGCIIILMLLMNFLIILILLLMMGHILLVVKLVLFYYIGTKLKKEGTL